MKAQLTDNLNGVSVPVTATTDNSACSYGQAVWVDAEGRAYCQVSLPTPPIFTITDVVVDLSERDLLGQYIHGLRLTCGKSIRELAEECGLSPATITDIEYGEFSPQADILQRLFAALGASVTIKQ